jgi:hypothetical protein
MPSATRCSTRPSGIPGGGFEVRNIEPAVLQCQTPPYRSSMRRCLWLLVFEQKSTAWQMEMHILYNKSTENRSNGSSFTIRRNCLYLRNYYLNYFNLWFLYYVCQVSSPIVISKVPGTIHSICFDTLNNAKKRRTKRYNKRKEEGLKSIT